MQVILLDFVRHLGDKDDVVEVKPGYANNFLFPQKLAVPATKSAMKALTENQRQASHRRDQQIAEAKAVADKLEQLEVTLEALVGQDDKIFGSVTPLQVANYLKEKGFEVDRRKVLMADDIKALGEYDVEVVLDKEVRASLKVIVVAKEEATA